MTARQPFNPAYTQGQTVTPAAAAATINVAQDSNQICLTNLGANVAYVRISSAGAAATIADYPVPPGTQQVISKGLGQGALSHISPLGTTLHVMPGEGF